MANLIAKGKRHILVAGDTFDVMRRSFLGNRLIVSFPLTDEGLVAARATFDALDPGVELIPPPGVPYKRQSRPLRITGYASAIGVLVALAVVAALVIPTATDHSDVKAIAPKNIVVAVTDMAGDPLTGAQVFIAGTQNKALTDAAGQSHLTSMKPGIYEVDVSEDGYMFATAELHVGKSAPAPIQVALAYEPPIGTFDAATNDGAYEVLQIISTATAQFAVESWNCDDSNWLEDQVYTATYDAKTGQFLNSSGTDLADVVGPKELSSVWHSTGYPLPAPTQPEC